MKNLYDIKDIKFSYGDDRSEIKSLSGLNLSIKKGEKWAVTGASGCGKSTFLKLLSGVMASDSGEILFKGEVLKKRMDSISYLLQDYGLFPWKTTKENIALPLILRGRDKKECEREAVSYLSFLGLEKEADSYPQNLSGGQRQRLALGRALISKPEVILLDEPFSALDSMTRENLQDYTLKLAIEKEITYILVTHNIEEAVYMADRILILGHGERRVMDVHTEYFDRSSAEFSETVNNLRNILGGGEDVEKEKP